MSATAEKRRTVLEAFYRAIQREAHNLIRWPELLWQQIYNEVQWEEPAVRNAVSSELARRMAPSANLWLHRLTPLRRSPSLLRIFEGHTGDVNGVAVSPDGSFIVSASSDNTLRIWDTRTGEERSTLREGDGDRFFSSCAISPDGSFLVTSTGVGVEIWDLGAGERLRTLGEGWGWGAVAPDGSFVVFVGPGKGLIKLIDPLTGEELRTLEGSANAGSSGCAMAPDGSFIVSATHLWDDHRLKLWDPATGKELRTLEGHHEESVRCCAVAPDASFVVSASLDGTLKLWDPATGHEIRALKGHKGSVWGCAVAPDASFVVSASSDRTLKLWDPATGEELQTLEGHTDAVSCCAVAPDGSFVVSAGSREDPTLKMWDPHRQQVARAADWHDGEISCCAVSPDGSFLVTGSEDKALKLWDPATGECLRTLEGHTSAIDSCAVAPDGSLVVSTEVRSAAEYDNTLKAWDPATGECLLTLDGHLGHVPSSAVSPDGSFIGSWGSFSLAVWNPENGEGPRSLHRHDEWISACAVSPDGSLVVSGTIEGLVRFWDLKTGQERSFTKHKGPPLTRKWMGSTGWGRVWDCAVSPDASFVVTASDNRTLKIWDPVTAECLSTLNGHAGPVRGCAVSPDGTLVVSASDDGTVRIWQAETGQLLTLIRLFGAIPSLSVHPYRRLLMCGDSTGNVNRIELVGIDYGPIIVTAIEKDGRRTVRCPMCWQLHAAEDSWLGQVMDCPTPTCDLQLRVNPFVAGPLTSGPRRRLFGRKRP